MRFQLPIFGPGPFVNLTRFSHWSDREADAAWTNASSHVAWAIAIPLLGYFIRPDFFWPFGVVWIIWSLYYESFLHAPRIVSTGYPAEVRTDLLTRLVPTFVLFLIEALR